MKLLVQALPIIALLFVFFPRSRGDFSFPIQPLAQRDYRNERPAFAGQFCVAHAQ